MSALESAIAQRGAELAAALEQARAARERVAELDLVADRLTERVVAGEQELAQVRAQLERAHAESADAVRSLVALAEELAEIRAQARGQATRIRMGALRDAAALSERIAARLADAEVPSGALLDALGEALERIEAESGGERSQEPVEAQRAGRSLERIEAESGGEPSDEPIEVENHRERTGEPGEAENHGERSGDSANAELVPPEPGSEITVRAGSRAAADDRSEGAKSKTEPEASWSEEPPDARPGARAGRFASPESGAAASGAPSVDGSPVRVAEDVFVGAVEIEVGPLADFSQLVAFEDATAALPAVSEVVVTRFAQGRATLAIRLAEPVQLVRELEPGVPFGFEVRSVAADRIELDLVAG